MTQQLRKVCDGVVGDNWAYPTAPTTPCFTDDLWKYCGITLPNPSELVVVGFDRFDNEFLENSIVFPHVTLVVLGEDNRPGFNFAAIRPNKFPKLQMVVVLSPPGEYTWGGFPPTLHVAVDRAYAKVFRNWPKERVHVFDGATDGDPVRLAGLLRQYLPK